MAGDIGLGVTRLARPCLVRGNSWIESGTSVTRTALILIHPYRILNRDGLESLALLAGGIDPVPFQMAYQFRHELTRPVRLLFGQVHFNERL